MGFKKGLNDGIPIALGYLSVSFTFGLMAAAQGLKLWQATLVSMMCLTSAGQFAGIGIMTAAGGCLEMALTQFVINIRYSLMSIAVSQKADKSMNTLSRLVIGFGITDEIFAVAVGRNSSVGRSYMAGLILLPFLTWSLGTLIGAAAGSILPDILCDALGIAIYAMFLAIIIPPSIKNKRAAAVILISVAISCIRYYTPLSGIISTGFTVITASVISAAIGALFFPIAIPKEGQDHADG